jgi:hypothetical protein
MKNTWVYIQCDKLIADTLKNPKTGRHSRKNWTGFVSFIFSMAYVTFCTITNRNVQEFVLVPFLTVTMTCFGMSSWEKVNLKQDGTETP